MPLLEIQHVSKYFGGLAANADVSFSVERGTIVGLIGPNGAGKTTLFDCVTGFQRPDRGQVRFRGIRLNGLSPAQVCRLGLARTWQKVRPLARMSVLDNVMVGALARTRRLEVARAEALEQLRVVRLAARAEALAGEPPHRRAQEAGAGPRPRHPARAAPPRRGAWAGSTRPRPAR